MVRHKNAQQNEPSSTLEVSLEEADRAFREALAYALFVTNPQVVSMVTACRRPGSDLEESLEIFWKDAGNHAGHIAWADWFEAIRRAGVVHEEMVKRLEKVDG
jgi:hypothetical protein